MKHLSDSLIKAAMKRLEEDIPQHELREAVEQFFEAVAFSTTQMEIIAQTIAGIAGIEDTGSPQATIKRAIQTFITKSHTPEGWRLFGKMIVMFIDAGIRLQGVLAQIRLPTLKAIGVIKVYKNGDRYSVSIAGRNHTCFEADGSEVMSAEVGEEMAVLMLPPGVQAAVREMLSQY